MDIGAVFNRVYNGDSNFMTPTLVKHLQVGGLVVEVSKGRGMSQDTIYGVTVIELPGVKRPDLCKCCFSMGEVTRYIACLREEDDDV